jgi:hypothetical protein
MGKDLPKSIDSIGSLAPNLFRIIKKNKAIIFSLLNIFSSTEAGASQQWSPVAYNYIFSNERRADLLYSFPVNQVYS